MPEVSRIRRAAGLAAGPGGELAQQLFSSHQAQAADALTHMVGVAAAFAAYALCRLARWAEPQHRPFERETAEKDLENRVRP